MRKMIIVLCGLAALQLGACHSGGGKQSAPAADTGTVHVAVPVSDTLATQVRRYLGAYYALKDAFVKSDTVLADSAAGRLLEASLMIHPDELRSDTARYGGATAAIGGLAAEIAGLRGERTMLGKRQEFQMISDITYRLIKNTGMKDQTVYRDYCPMFNSGDGAFWLSDSLAIQNPYYGTDMPDCGQLSETIKF